MNNQNVDAQTILELLGVSYPTLQRYKKEGLPFQKEGKSDVYDPEAVLKWMAEKKQKKYMVKDAGLIQEEILRIKKLTEAEQVEVLSSFLMTRKEAIETLGLVGKTVDDLGQRQAILPVVRGVFLRSSVERRKQEMERRENEGGQQT